MSQHNPCETIGNYTIYLNKTYFLAYSGGTGISELPEDGRQQLSERDQKEYNKILTLPLLAQKNELAKMPMEKNPNVFPIKGKKLLEYIKDFGTVPFFDSFFNKTGIIKLTNSLAFEYIKKRTNDEHMAEFKNGKIMSKLKG